nr:uncharacterized protein LOC101937722 isoform X4 [Chrysemys picta bellii]
MDFHTERMRKQDMVNAGNRAHTLEPKRMGSMESYPQETEKQQLKNQLICLLPHLHHQPQNRLEHWQKGMYKYLERCFSDFRQRGFVVGYDTRGQVTSSCSSKRKVKPNFPVTLNS